MALTVVLLLAPVIPTLLVARVVMLLKTVPLLVVDLLAVAVVQLVPTETAAMLTMPLAVPMVAGKPAVLLAVVSREKAVKALQTITTC